MAAEELDVWKPSMLALSPLQRREGMPQKFWAQMLPRLANREMTIDPGELACAMQPYVPIEPAGVGQKA